MLKKWLKKLPFGLTKNHRYDLQAKKIMDLVLQTDACCVDVGCHEGEFLDLFLAKAPKGQHFAFEPLPDYFQQLQKKYTDKCQLFEIALSHQRGETTFNYVVSNPAYSGLQKRNYDKKGEVDTQITVQTDRLDEVLPKNQRIDFIKIDVEGGEYGVLKGGKETIRREKPVIIFEHGLGAADVYGTTPEVVYDFLVGVCDLNVSTMSAYLSDEKGFSKAQFAKHFYQNIDYYFLAFP